MSEGFDRRAIELGTSAALRHLDGVVLLRAPEADVVVEAAALPLHASQVIVSGEPFTERHTFVPADPRVIEVIEGRAVEVWRSEPPRATSIRLRTP